MNKLLAIPVLAAVGLSAYSCNPSNEISTTAAAIAALVAHSNQACSDLMILGSSISSISTSIAAANPNNSTIQSIAAQVAAGTATTNAECQELAAAFTAEAPKSLLTKEIKIDRAILDRIK